MMQLHVRLAEGHNTVASYLLSQGRSANGIQLAPCISNGYNYIGSCKWLAIYYSYS